MLPQFHIFTILSLFSKNITLQPLRVLANNYEQNLRTASVLPSKFSLLQHLHAILPPSANGYRQGHSHLSSTSSGTHTRARSMLSRSDVAAASCLLTESRPPSLIPPAPASDIQKNIQAHLQLRKLHALALPQIAIRCSQPLIDVSVGLVPFLHQG